MRQREIGTVSYWNKDKGYGFVVLTNNEDIFCHVSQILGDGDDKYLIKGQQVELTVAPGNQKGPLGEDILILSQEFIKD